MKYLEQVGLTKKAHNYPSQLSGDTAACSHCRALNMHRIILFDEPTSP